MGQTFLRSAAQSCIVVIFLLFLAASNAIGQGTNPFFTPPTFPGGGQALTADVNGDGKPDLLFFDGTVLLGKGDGTFTTGTSWKPSGTLTAGQFAIADFNGDGKADILVAGPVNQLSVLLGKGDGTFQAPVTTSIASPATGFVVGDLNGDGKPDVLAQTGSGSFTYIGKGDGTFAAGIASNSIDASASDSFADFNGDGKLDLFVAGQGIQLGNGNGTFQALLAFPSGALPGSNTVGDFDGDGKLDVAASEGTSTSAQIQVLFGNGDGTFRAAPVQSLPVNTALGDLVVGDLNGDGKADLIGSTSSAVQVLIGKGDGTFTAGNFYNAPKGGPGSIVVADFNGDGKKDVAAFNTMLLGNGDGTLQGDEAVPNLAGSGVTGDFNGDGHPDLALITPTTSAAVNLNIWLNDGKANFTPAHSYQIPIPSPGIDSPGLVSVSSAADLNGDGKIDLAGTIWDASGLTVIVLLGNGDGSFGAPIASRVSNQEFAGIGDVAFALGDLNGDGKPDVLLSVEGRGAALGFFVLPGNGDGTFGAPSTPFVSEPEPSITLGDFNNDKKLDAIIGTSNGIGVLLGNGDGTFQPTTFIANAGCTLFCFSLVNGDFNGDGNLDLIVPATTGYQVLLGKGDGTFNISPAVTDSAGMFQASQVADFNGDGHLDVLGILGSANGLILGNGDGTFQSPFSLPVAGSTLVGDFDGDGRPDIAVLASNQLVWLFNGAGPNFSMTAGPGATATVSAGKTANYSLSLAGSGGFSGAVTLSCSGAPAGTVCDVSPSTVTLSGTTPVSATVSVTTTAASQLLPSAESDRRDPDRRIFWILGLFLVAAGVTRSLAVVRGPRRRLSFSFASVCGAIVLIAASLITGCGGSGSGFSSGSNSGSGGGSGATGTPAGNYTITVTATAGSGANVVSHTTKLTLVVR